MKNKHTIYLIPGRSHPELKERLLFALNEHPEIRAVEIPVEFRDFANGEIYCRSKETIRGKRVFVLQTANAGRVNQDLMELFVLLNAIKLASPEKVYLIMPHLPYSRQERKDIPRAPISAALIAEILTKVCNIQTLVTFDLHQYAIEGFYATMNVPVAHLTTMSLFHQYFKEKFQTGELERRSVGFASPDMGGLKLVRRLAKYFQLEDRVAAINKIRHLDGTVENRVFGEVKEKNIIIFDDIIDRGTSILLAIDALQKQEEKNFYVAAVHGLFSEKAIQRLNEREEIKEVVVTDTINHKHLPPKFKTISIAPTLAEVLKRIYLNQSLKDYEIITL